MIEALNARQLEKGLQLQVCFTLEGVLFTIHNTIPHFAKCRVRWRLLSKQYEVNSPHVDKIGAIAYTNNQKRLKTEYETCRYL